MPLKVTRRKSTGALTIGGTVAGRRIRRRAQSDSLALAREEAAALEAEILRTEWHGERRGSRTLAEAIVSYLESQPRTEGTKARLRRIRAALGDVQLASVDQDAAIRLRHSMLRAEASPATYTREIIAPLRALLLHAHKRGWCDAPHFEVPRQPQGRTRFLLPLEAERLILAAAPHLKPLITFLICTGARMSEALELEWRDVDLAGGKAIFWRTKNGRVRVASLPPRIVGQLSGQAREPNSQVFTTQAGRYYAPRDREAGGQIKRGWAAACARAGLPGEWREYKRADGKILSYFAPELTPHTCRHSWATWHYALHKDLLALKEAGGWSSVTLVERYAHLMPVGHEDEIRHFLGTDDIGITVSA